MSRVEFSRKEKEAIVGKIKLYFGENLDHEIGQFDAEFLLDFFCDEIGAYFYNRGLYDAHTILEGRLESITEAIYEIEKPTEVTK
jgi:uncharacterized protein (DUF2164 family)